MSLKTAINLSFNTLKNNQFILSTSSEHSTLTAEAAEVAGSYLKKVVSLLGSDHPTLCAQAQKIDATLKPILQGATTYYLMELKLDGRALLAASNKLLQIKLNEKFVKTLSGGTTPPQKELAPNQHKPPSSFENTKTKSFNISPQQPIKTPSIWEIVWEFIKALFALFQKQELTLSPNLTTNQTLSFYAGFFNAQEKDVTFIDGVRPLRNNGNDCFVNAIFQVIMHDKVLLDALLKTFENDYSAQAQAFQEAARAYQKDTTPLSVKNLRSFIDAWWSQEDASDLLCNIMNAVRSSNHPECYTQCTVINHWELKNPSESSAQVPLNTTTSISSLEFLIPLQLPDTASQDDVLDGQQLIDELQQEQPHQGEDWKREAGGTYQAKKVQTAIDKNASRLIFQLKRFTKTGKKGNPVDMPEVLQVNGNGYQLKSIVVHSGDSKDAGHYYSLVHKEIGWVKCNDEDVEPIEDISSDLLNGYIYFYEKTT